MSSAIGGAPLAGKRLVRLTYLDESGLFNAGQEPYVVVGGAIVNADAQMERVEEAIDTLVQKHIPEDDRDGFVFHATELWSGGRYFKRDKWSLEKRLEILADLVNIIPEIGIPLIYGCWSRKQCLTDQGKLNGKEYEQMMHMMALTEACIALERYMRDVADDEITILIAEYNGEIKHTAKYAFHRLRTDNELTRAEDMPELQAILPFRKIKDTVHFADKQESKCLQIADLCTFFAKKRLVKDKKARAFYDVLKPYFLFHPMSDGDKPPRR